MATSEAQKRASAKYRKNNVKAIMFNLYLGRAFAKGSWSHLRPLN